MPAKVADALGLTLTKTIGRCYSMERQVPLVGQIKDAQAVLASFPDKRLKMTILVADIPVSYGMLLSRNFCKELGGEVKMDWSCAHIPIKGVNQKLEPEKKSKYTVSKSEDPRSQILFQESDHGVYYLEMDKEDVQPVIQEPHQLDNKIWTLEFDGSCCSFGSGASVVLISPEGKVHAHSFKLMFENTNNTAEYEALLLGMEQARTMGIKLLHAKGDAELIVKQIRGLYQVKKDKLRHYRDRVYSAILDFSAFSVSYIPREQNSRADSLAVTAALLNPDQPPAFFRQGDYKVEMVFRPKVPDNVQQWQVFNDDTQIAAFLQ
ncbi:hypothetical protein KI387_041753 [Taxus chinensis]|uniref:RNase H type-1 domain-containing protein n=1 Tax=Taxus chinensis TaxID=29808 RepID=A0AA38C1M9_TAXCH|nr:hypothetical protein KI387_041753 [Taxus chinensis]